METLINTDEDRERIFDQTGIAAECPLTESSAQHEPGVSSISTGPIRPAPGPQHPAASIIPIPATDSFYPEQLQRPQETLPPSPPWTDSAPRLDRQPEVLPSHPEPLPTLAFLVCQVFLCLWCK